MDVDTKTLARVKVFEVARRALELDLKYAERWCPGELKALTNPRLPIVRAAINAKVTSFNRVARACVHSGLSLEEFKAWCKALLSDQVVEICCVARVRLVVIREYIVVKG